MKAYLQRGSLLSLALAFLLSLPASLAVASAQDASPDAGASLFGDLELPALEITITNDGVEMPSEVDAGPILLTIDNQSDDYASVTIAQLPDGIPDDEFLAALSSDELPAWTGDVMVPGGADLEPMTNGTGIIVLAAGEWRVGTSSENPAVATVVPLAVTGEIDEAAVDALPSDLEVSLGAYAFDLPDTIAAGPQVVKMTNTHSVLHHLIIFQSDRLYSPEEVEAGLGGMVSGTPVPDGFDLHSSPPVLVTSALSEGQSMWIGMDLEPGAYVALCFLPDPGHSLPHAFSGMIDTFEVTGN